MRAVVKQTCTAVCLPGSVIEVSEEQFAALGGLVDRIETPEAVVKAAVETPEAKPVKKPAAKAKKG